MSRAVSIVVPALGLCAHLERSLLALSRALAQRCEPDELVLVDDSGRAELTAWAARHWPAARVIEHSANAGFARALHSGLQAARHELVFCMNSDLAPQPGFLEPLIAALDDARVFAASPRVQRAGGGPGRIESLTRMEFARGRLRVRQPFMEESALPPGDDLLTRTRPLPFALGGAGLLRRADYFSLGGFDELFEPFYLEDVDLCWRAWRAGQVCVHVPESVVEHSNQATIGAVARPELVAAAIARNHWLFEWKHLDGAQLQEHLAALDTHLFDIWLAEDRAALEVLALALEQSERALQGRAPACEGRDFAALVRASDPLGD